MVTLQTGRQSTGLSRAGESGIVDTVLHHVVQLAKTHRNEFARELAKLNVYVGQEQVLVQLWNEEGLTQADLAERIHTAAPTVSKMLRRMERAGLVRRERDDRWGRMTRIFLTDRGRELRGPVEALWEHSENQLTAELAPGERLALIDLLARLRARQHLWEPE